LPHDGLLAEDPVFAGAATLNGNGELTGLEWLRESGLLMSPIGLTNSHSVGVVRDALVADEIERRAVRRAGAERELYWSLPVVGETWDGLLNDVDGRHVTAEHVRAALSAAAGGPVAEGNVGGGTGMVCHDFKGGIGTASRLVDCVDGATAAQLVPVSGSGSPAAPWQARGVSRLAFLCRPTTVTGGAFRSTAPRWGRSFTRASCRCR
jgi:D-aminopeptidase